MRVIHAVILLAVAGATIAFCIQNKESVTVNFLNWSATLPFPVLVLAVYLLGMLSGWSVLSILRRSLRNLTESSKSS